MLACIETLALRAGLNVRLRRVVSFAQRYWQQIDTPGSGGAIEKGWGEYVSPRDT